jgi:hypothetical protein
MVLLLRLRRTQSELDSARVPSFVYVVVCSCRRVDVVGVEEEVKEEYEDGTYQSHGHTSDEFTTQTYH